MSKTKFYEISNNVALLKVCVEMSIHQENYFKTLTYKYDTKILISRENNSKNKTFNFYIHHKTEIIAIT